MSTRKTWGRHAAAWLAGTLAFLPSSRAEVLTLEDCLRETAAHNPTLIVQQLDVQRATGTRLTLRARALPTLAVAPILGYQGTQNAQEQRTTTRLANGTTRTTATTTERPAQAILLGTGALTQSLFDAAIPASWRLGDVSVLAARQSYYTVAVAELHLARTLFNLALYEQQRDEVLRATDKVLDANAKAVEALVKAGISGRQAFLTAQVRRVAFTPAAVEAAGSYRTALASLLQTMGRRPGVGPGGEDALVHVTLRGALDETGLAFDSEAVGKEALAHRPDILSLREQVRSLQESARIVRGGYYPRVQIYLAGELLPENFVRSSRPNAIRSSDQVQTSELRPGVREDWSVIDTGTVRGEARRVDAVRAEIEVGLQRLERSVPGELAAVRASMDSNAAVLGTLRGNVDTAQNTLNIINSGVAQGVNSQLEFLDAQSNLLLTRVGILDAAYTLTQARAEFDRITGRYLRFVADDASAPSSRPRRP